MIRICIFQADGQTRLGLDVNGSVVDFNLAYALSENKGAEPRWKSVIDFLSDGQDKIEVAQRVHKFIGQKGKDLKGPHGKQVVFDPATIKFLAPIVRPPKFLCIAGNYRAHINEGIEGKKKTHPDPTDIHVFTKPTNTAPLGHNSTIEVSSKVKKLDYELEIGIVIGLRGRNIPADKARDHIAGYTIVNDVSDRAFVQPQIHWFAMKSQDNFGPMGPFILLKTGLPHPLDLAMELRVNGEIRQRARTTQMIFDPSRIVSRLSDWVTLEPGDVIATGTPAGVAMATGNYLKDGDEIEVEIENIGILRNRIAFKEPTYVKG